MLKQSHVKSLLTQVIVSCMLIAHAHARTVYFALPYDNKDVMQDYHVLLLAQALSYSQTPYTLKPAAETMSQSRALREMANETGVVDVYWSMTSEERERQLMPIRVPLDRGLMGWRLLLVNTNQPFLLVNPKKTDTLFVQGHDWPDSEILVANDIKIHTTNDYHAMFVMVEKGRADAMPRSVLEVFEEKKGVARNLFIASDVMLYYPTAEYFFVAKNDKDLAAAIEYGLNRMVKDGSFNTLFNQYFGSMLAQLQVKNRKVIKLANPQLPTLTPLDKSEYWQPIPDTFEFISW